MDTLLLSKKSIHRGGILRLCFTALAVLSAFMASADVTIGKITYSTDPDSHTATVTAADADITSAIIPSEITEDGADYSVTKIGDRAFANCTSLAEVSIPESVTSIGEWAFSYCTALTEVSIPASVTEIDKVAFGFCDGLQKAEFASIEALCNINFVTNSANPLSCAHHLFINGEEITEVIIPEGLISIGKSTFCGAGFITSVSIPESVKEIGGAAFYECTALQKAEFASIPSIFRIKFGGTANSNPMYYAKGFYINGEEMKDVDLVVPEDVTEIGNNAFINCTGIRSLTLHDSVTSIGDYAFYSCTDLKEVDFGNSLTKIGIDSFWSCTSLASLTFPESLKEIGANAFRFLPITSLTLPESLTSLGTAAFGNCESLTTVNFPNSLKEIPVLTFTGCTSLAEIKLPDSIESIGFYAFYKCSSMKSINIPEKTHILDPNAFTECTGLQEVFFDAENCTSEYTSTSYPFPANVENVTFGDKVQVIPGYLFYNCTGLKNLNLGNSVSTIGAWAFAGCTAIEYVKIPASVEKICKSAFFGCYALKIADFDSVESLCKIEFEGIYSNPLINILIDKGVIKPSVSIENSGLYIGGESATDVRIPDTIKEIRDYAFMAAVNIKTLEIPNSVVSIGFMSFRWCINLTSLTIPESVTKIDDRAFAFCSSLTSVSLPNSLTILGPAAFWECTSLQEITIPNSISALSTATFANCSSLRKATISNSVTQIGTSAFANCSALEEIILPPSLTNIDEGAFRGDTNLKNVVMGPNVSQIGESTFDGCEALESVSVTAPVPPTAQANTFTSYSAPLYVTPDKVGTYAATEPCWNQFSDIRPLTPVQEIKVDGPASVDLKDGETYQILTSVSPSDCDRPYVFFSSSNPDLAYVDNDGLVTFYGTDKAIARRKARMGENAEDITSDSCVITCVTLYSNVPKVEILINRSTSGIEDLTSKTENITSSRDIYNLQGVMLKRGASDDDVRALSPGLYIISGKKVMVR